MNKYEVTFSGSMIVEANNPQHAEDLVLEDFGADVSITDVVEIVA